MIDGAHFTHFVPEKGRNQKIKNTWKVLYIGSSINESAIWQKKCPFYDFKEIKRNIFLEINAYMRLFGSLFPKYFFTFAKSCFKWFGLWFTTEPTTCKYFVLVKEFSDKGTFRMLRISLTDLFFSASVILSLGPSKPMTTSYGVIHIYWSFRPVFDVRINGQKKRNNSTICNDTYVCMYK